MTPLTLELVKRALAAPRPGLASQLQMSPHPRPGALPPPPPANPRREAGVLILLYLQDQELYFVLTVRTLSVATHKGQISLPGGAREGTERLDGTARRETGEELGLDADCIEILGAPLTPLYIPVSEFWVTAYVGFLDGRPVFMPEPGEVLELIETPLAALLDDRTVQEEMWELHGGHVWVPLFNIQGYKVWGATAMMLSEFKTMLRQQVETQTGYTG